MTKNFIFVIIGVLLTILIFSGIFAGLPKKRNLQDTSQPQAVQQNAASNQVKSQR